MLRVLLLRVLLVLLRLLVVLRLRLLLVLLLVLRLLRLLLVLLRVLLVLLRLFLRLHPRAPNAGWLLRRRRRLELAHRPARHAPGILAPRPAYGGP
jgi:hypothetical protein